MIRLTKHFILQEIIFLDLISLSNSKNQLLDNTCALHVSTVLGKLRPAGRVRAQSSMENVAIRVKQIRKKKSRRRRLESFGVIWLQAGKNITVVAAERLVAAGTLIAARQVLTLCRDLSFSSSSD